MAIQYDIKEREGTGAAMSGIGPRSLQSVQIKAWDVLVSDDGRQLRPDEITEQKVLQDVTGQKGIPIANEDVFSSFNPAYDTAVQIVPWLIASSKRIERDPINRLLFHVTAEYSTGQREKLEETELYLIDAPTSALTELPFLVEIIYNGEDRVLYEEAKTGGQAKLRLPTGSLFSEPFMRRWVTQRIRQSQFETFADQTTLENMIEDRLFTTNATEFRGHSADPPRWWCTDIEYQKVRVPNAAGTGVIEGYLMTYLLDRNTYDGGWYDRRALIDKYYLETPNDLSTKTLYRDPTDKTTVIDALLQSDGTLLANQASAVPEYENFTVQRTLDWSFLRQ